LGRGWTRAAAGDGGARIPTKREASALSEGSTDDKTADAAFFASTLWKGIGISQWSLERLIDKARIILGMPGLVLTVVTVGLFGLAAALGANIWSLASLNRLFYGVLGPLLVAGLFGMASVVASMVFSTVALRSFRADNIVGRSNFTTLGDEAGKVDDLVLDRCVRMPKKERYALYRSYIRRLDDLAKSNRRMDRYVRLAHMCPLYGLVAIFVISATVIVGIGQSLGTPAANPA